MRVSVTEAKAQLTDLVRRAETGEEIMLTRHGQPTVRLVPVKAATTRESRRSVIEAAQRAAADKATSGPCAARSQDYLYGDDGMPA
jgi:prevent-host-death family protein